MDASTLLHSVQLQQPESYPGLLCSGAVVQTARAVRVCHVVMQNIIQRRADPNSGGVDTCCLVLTTDSPLPLQKGARSTDGRHDCRIELADLLSGHRLAACECTFFCARCAHVPH